MARTLKYNIFKSHIEIIPHETICTYMGKPSHKLTTKLHSLKFCIYQSYRTYKANATSCSAKWWHKNKYQLGLSKPILQVP